MLGAVIANTSYALPGRSLALRTLFVLGITEEKQKLFIDLPSSTYLLFRLRLSLLASIGHYITGLCFVSAY